MVGLLIYTCHLQINLQTLYPSLSVSTQTTSPAGIKHIRHYPHCLLAGIYTASYRLLKPRMANEGNIHMFLPQR